MFQFDSARKLASQIKHSLSAMSCECEKLFDCEAWSKREVFVEKMSLVASVERRWSELFKCNNCGQLWSVDIEFQYGGYAYKVKANEDWLKIDIRKMTKEYLIRKDGGLSNEICVYISCKNYALKGIKVCVDHKYDLGT